MQSCDECPGSTQCSGYNLHFVLVRVYDLYQSGKTNKFDILFSLSEDDEQLLERYTQNVERACWTKAALLAIVEILTQLSKSGKLTADDDLESVVFETIKGARDAFSSFPWHLQELVEQAADLHAQIQEQCPDEDLCEQISKRGFVKICKSIAFA